MNAKTQIGNISVNRGFSYLPAQAVADKIKALMDKGIDPRSIGIALYEEGIEKDDTLKVAAAWGYFNNYPAWVTPTVEHALPLMRENRWPAAVMAAYYVKQGVPDAEAKRVAEEAEKQITW